MKRYFLSGFCRGSIWKNNIFVWLQTKQRLALRTVLQISSLINIPYSQLEIFCFVLFSSLTGAFCMTLNLRLHLQTIEQKPCFATIRFFLQAMISWFAILSHGVWLWEDFYFNIKFTWLSCNTICRQEGWWFFVAHARVDETTCMHTRSSYMSHHYKIRRVGFRLYFTVDYSILIGEWSKMPVTITLLYSVHPYLWRSTGNEPRDCGMQGSKGAGESTMALKPMRKVTWSPT